MRRYTHVCTYIHVVYISVNKYTRLTTFVYTSKHMYTQVYVSIHTYVHVLQIHTSMHRYIYYYMSERVLWIGFARVCRYFLRAEGEGKYYTRVQCLAISSSPECNDRFIIYYLQAVLLG